MAGPHTQSDPHGDRQLETAGAPLAVAEAGVVMVHGRGATAKSILRMADDFYEHGVAYVAPQAARNTWYRNSFLAPLESNEPGLSSGLEAVRNAVSTLTDAGIPLERIVLLGFSQGACLASEFVARNATRYGGLAVLSGGVIGPDGTPREYDGSLEGTPVFIGCSNVDPHIPLERVHETTVILEDLGGDVDERVYDGMGHAINEDEIDAVSEMVARLLEND